MRSSSRGVLLLSCFAVLAAVLCWQLRAQDGQAPVTRAQSPAATAAPTSSPANAAPPSGDAQPEVLADISGSTLPPDVATLLARAQSGDARAACELGVRFQECFRVAFFDDRMLEGLARQEKAQQAKGKLAEANQTAAFLLAGASARELCEGIPPALYERASDFLRQAALAGEPEAVFRYARGEALATDPMQQFTFLRHPRFDTWRNEAVPLLEAQLHEGKPGAVVAMLEARSQGMPPIGMLIPADPLLDQAYRQLAGRLFDNHPALHHFDPVTNLTAEQLDEAGRLAAQWHETWFAGRRFTLEDHLAGFAHYAAADLPGWPRDVPASSPCAPSIQASAP